MYLVKNGTSQFYCNDDQYDTMDALGYELYKIEEVPANDAAKNTNSRTDTNTITILEVSEPEEHSGVITNAEV